MMASSRLVRLSSGYFLETVTAQTVAVSRFERGAGFFGQGKLSTPATVEARATLELGSASFAGGSSKALG